ncbi:MAG: 2-C-methyl-D-erythritol 2,4-cyclodiphosphate synthase [Bacteroides sp.]|jgi:2-C-methyl-D-erythritol 2,4-cyclodiphosphate synthase|nr:2-C-methyl-D-erythritol 2,4-cyclodiphosphate synthase [Bacteroides sp.]
MDFRVGFGYDVHRLGVGRPLVLGGITIPYHKGGIGHSDADVLIHAIMDALLGAAGLRDIGFYFPDQDPSFKDIDSKILLQKTFQLVKEKGFSLGNLDTTVCLEKPKIAGLIPEMRKVLAEILEVEEGLVSIKATTNEGMGFTGREEGLKAYAVVLLIKKS